MKRLICMILALVLALGMVACGAAEEPKVQEIEAVVAADPTEAEAAEDTLEEGMAVYTIHVQDVDGNPIAGAMVQICKDACLPGMTDAEGNAVFTVAEDDYKVSFLMLPAGYTYTTEETEFYFDGATEITLTLKAE